MINPADVLRSLANHLDQARVSWALVGGLAVSVRTSPRFTEDLDVVVAVGDDLAAEALGRDLVQRGYRITAVVEHETAHRMAMMRLAVPDAGGVVADLLVASSGIEAEIAMAATPVEVVGGCVVPVARVGHLIAMKVLSSEESRPLDHADLLALVAVAGGDEIALARRAVELIFERGFNRDRDLAALLEQLLDR